ncbi:MBL fold metallo-hydrolase [Patescibacteria group bacterium]|nr:MBL fold metallo-hydrolase [Patescibacteria group bacterium]
MKISFFGAVGNVTGSKHILEVDGFKILLDCGLYQGRRSETEKLNRNMPFDTNEIDAIILSHAHADHSGLLPVIVRQGFRGNIYCTDATADIVKYILADSAAIQEQDCNYMNSHLSSDEAMLEPLYTVEDAKKVFPLFSPVPYFRKSKQWTKLNENIRFKFYDAGHILGSAVTVIEVKRGNKIKTLAYTGDLGQPSVPILRHPEKITENIDVLLTETTYGDRVHPPMADGTQLIINLVKKIIARKGKIIMPAFSLGRTQEIVYLLHKLTDEGKIPRLPIYVDSPLSNLISDVFRHHDEDFNEDVWKDFGVRQESAFDFRNLFYISAVEDSKRLNSQDGPFMIISASGMAEGGRVLFHLKNNIGNKNNLVLLTGYQAEHTLGRKIQDGEKKVNILGKSYEVEAEVMTINSLSAHADKNGLMSYLSSIPGLKKVFLVHSEPSQAASFKKALEQEHPSLQVEIPIMGQSCEI